MVEKQDIRPQLHGMMLLLAAAALLFCGCLPQMLSNMMARKVTLPVKVEKAAGAGSLHFELVYDTANLRVLEVQQGQLSSGGLFEYNMDYPGIIVFGIADLKGIEGDGEIALVTFRVAGRDSSPIPISLENVFIHSADSLEPIAVDPSPGSITPKEGGYKPPVIVFSQD